MRAIDKMILKAKLAIYDVIHNEKGEVNIVAIVVLIGIAVLLAIFFRKQIEKLLNTLFSSIENNANKAITGGN